MSTLTLAESPASHNGSSAALTASVRKTADHSVLRRYSPFVVLGFGFMVTIAWVATIAWFVVHLVTSNNPASSFRVTLLDRISNGGVLNV